MDQPSPPRPRSSGVLLHPTALPGSPVCGSFGEPSRRWLQLLADHVQRIEDGDSRNPARSTAEAIREGLHREDPGHPPPQKTWGCFLF